MKKSLLALSVFLISVTFSGFTSSQKNIASEKLISESFTCQFGQCQATAKSTGNRCKHCVSNSGDKFCYQHK